MSAVDKDGNPVGPQPLDVAAVYAREIESLRAQLAESEARREQWRETSDVQEGDLTTLRAAHEAALARIGVLEEAVRRLAYEPILGDCDLCGLHHHAESDHAEVLNHVVLSLREALGRKGT